MNKDQVLAVLKASFSNVGSINLPFTKGDPAMLPKEVFTYQILLYDKLSSRNFNSLSSFSIFPIRL